MQGITLSQHGLWSATTKEIIHLKMECVCASVFSACHTTMSTRQHRRRSQEVALHTAGSRQSVDDLLAAETVQVARK